jgi:hypothetical protein
MNLTANYESTNLWRNSLVMFGLFTAHVIINHRLASLGVAPVGTDPCDGVNGFAFITIAFIAIGSILRMFSGHHSSSPLRYLYTVRSQQAVLFAIFITFAAEIIALIRKPETWIGNRFAESVVALLGALTVVTYRHTAADPGYTTKQDIAERLRAPGSTTGVRRKVKEFGAERARGNVTRRHHLQHLNHTLAPIAGSHPAQSARPAEDNHDRFDTTRSWSSSLIIRNRFPS